MNKWQASIILLVLSNVLVGLSVIVQALVPYMRIDVLILIGDNFAVIGIILAVIQGFAASKEQKQELDRQIEIEKKTRTKDYKFLRISGMMTAAIVLALCLLLRFTVFKDMYEQGADGK